MATRRKIAISVAADIYREAEKLRRETGESRSAVYERAVAELLSQRRRSEAARQYAEAYRRLPESSGEIAAARSIAQVTLPAVPWDEAG